MTRNLITIQASSSLFQALNLFKTHKVSTLVVVGKNFISAGGRIDIFTSLGDQVVGLVTALDLSRIVLELDFQDLEKISVLNAIGESLESQSLWVLPLNSSLSSLLELFSKGIHSVFLKDDENLDIFTRMDLVKILLESKLNLKTLVKEIPLKKHVRKVSSDESLLKVLQEMSKNQIYALPITENEKLVGTISLSDFKNVILQENLQDLSLVSFKDSGKISRGTCNFDDSLEIVLSKILNGHIHRLWILEDEMPVGVLSISDICKFLHSKM